MIAQTYLFCLEDIVLRLHPGLWVLAIKFETSLQEEFWLVFRYKA